MDVSKLNTLAYGFVCVVATFGISYQLFLQTWDYFSYPSYSDIQFTPLVARIPAVSVCSTHQLYFERLATRSRVGPTMQEAMHRMPNESDVIDSCELTLPNGSVVACSSVSRVHKYMGDTIMCWSYFEAGYTYLPDNELIYSSESLVRHNIKTPFLRIRSNPSSRMTIGFNIYSSWKPLVNLRTLQSARYIDPKMARRAAIRIEMMKRRELPPPHGSCREYQYQTDSDREMVKCYYEKYITSNGTGYWPNSHFFDYETNYTEQDMNRRWPDAATNAKLFPQISVQCAKLHSRPDCENDYYSVPLRFRDDGRKPKDKSEMEIPWLPANQLVVTNLVKTTFFSYLDEIGNILSIWVGFSMSLLFSLVITLMKKVAKKIARTGSQLEVSTNPVIVLKSHGQEENNSTITGLKKMNNLSVRLLCWSVTVYYIVQITRIYFEKPFATSVIAVIPERIEVPQFTICFNMVIYPKKVKKLFPKIYHSVSHDKWNETLTIEQLFQTTLEWHEVYQEAKIAHSEDGTVPIEGRFSFTKSINGRLICFTTFGERQDLMPERPSKHTFGTLIHTYLMRLYLDTRKMYQLNISTYHVYINRDGVIHDYVTAPDRYTPFGHTKMPFSSSAIAYSQTTRRLYPDHMMSICTNYRDKFGFNREQMLSKCILERFTLKYHRWPVGQQIWQSDINRSTLGRSKKRGFIWFPLMNKSLDIELLKVENECREVLSRPECHQVFNKITSGNQMGFKKATMLLVYPPTKQLFTYEQQLIYNVVDLFGYVGGAIGTWIGFSFLDSQHLIFIILKKILRLKQSLSEEKARPGQQSMTLRGNRRHSAR